MVKEQVYRLSTTHFTAIRIGMQKPAEACIWHILSIQLLVGSYSAKPACCWCCSNFDITLVPGFDAMLEQESEHAILEFLYQTKAKFWKINA